MIFVRIDQHLENSRSSLFTIIPIIAGRPCILAGRPWIPHPVNSSGASLDSGIPESGISLQGGEVFTQVRLTSMGRQPHQCKHLPPPCKFCRRPPPEILARRSGKIISEGKPMFSMKINVFH